MAKYKLIQGGKGDEPRTPIEAPNTLKSVAIAYILDLVSEGEIKGLVNGLKSVYLDETPVMNADESLNFTNFNIDYRYGTQNQDYIPGFPEVENELGIGVEFTSTTPYERTFSNLSLNAVRVRLSVAALHKTDKENGDIKGGSVSYAIQLSTDGGPFKNVLTGGFIGKTMSKYERDHRIELPPSTTGWTIRVTRQTPNATDSSVQDKTYVESMVEIIDAKLRYPNSAIIGSRFEAKQFATIPGRAFDLYGRIIRVPSNYNAENRTYDGPWDGTFQLAYTNNPAWVYLDLVTHPRYGLGHLVTDANINKWALYDIAKYCDGMVPTGRKVRANVTTGPTSLAMTVGGNTANLVRTTGSFVTDGFQVGDAVTTTGFSTSTNNDTAFVIAVSALTMTLARPTGVAWVANAAAAGRVAWVRAPMEPRFTCNMYLQRQGQAYKVVQDLATVFRGVTYWAGGEIVGVADKPEDPVYTYTPANVIDGTFAYQGSARRTRYNVVLVSWSDPKNFGRQAVEYVDDPESILRYGIQQTDVSAIACSSQSQAQRIGRYMLATSNYETQTVTFQVGLDGTLVAPGKVVRIADPLRAGKRMGGRIVSATAAAVTLDKAPEIAYAAGDTLTIIKADGVAETRSITSMVGAVANVSPSFSEAPGVGTVWAIDKTNLETQLYRIISVMEDSSDGAITYSVNAVQHNPSKFNAVDIGTKMDEPIISTLTTLPAPTVTLTKSQRYGHGTAFNVIQADWQDVGNATSYEIEWQKDDGPWSGTRKKNESNDEWDSAFAGTYRARVKGIGPLGVNGEWGYSNEITVTDAVMPIIDLEINAGTVIIDCRYSQFRLLLNQNVTNVVFINAAPQDTLLLEITQAGGFTINFGSSVYPVNGVTYVVTPTAGSVDILGLTTNNSGVTWALVAQQPTSGGGGGPLAISLSPSPASNTVTTDGTTSSAPSVTVTTTVESGTVPVTHAWSRADAAGGANFLINDPTLAAPTFSIPPGVTQYGPVTQTWRNNATDAAGLTQQKSVAITLTRNAPSDLVNAYNGTVREIGGAGTTGPSGGTVQFNVLRNGTCTTYGWSVNDGTSLPGSTVGAGNWFSAAPDTDIGDTHEVLITQLTGSTANVTNGASTWKTLSTGRSVSATMSKTTSGASEITRTFSVTIREIADHANSVTGTITLILSADNS